MSADAQTRAFLERVGRAPSPRTVPIEDLRAATEDVARRFGLPPEPVASVREVEHGRLYEPENARGIVVYAHGGAFVRGSVDSHDGLTRALANGSGCAVLSVDYRLAPEHPFPAAFHDFGRALNWAVRQHAHVVIAGDSAGGNLAAAWARAASFQALIQPVLDLHATSPSIDLLGDEYGLPRDYIEWSNELYGADPDDPRASPLLRPARTPGFVVTGEYDPFRDEGQAYAAAAGVEHVRYAGLIHHAVLVPRAIARGEQVIRDAARRIGESA
ncbi:alpha/beta hydrolase [Solirubrobacter taibaiensis]|nr:alpha/beta hydrolase [Solirubrobacter taibaiensis]